jgi:hypothetical protein
MSDRKNIVPEITAAAMEQIIKFSERSEFLQEQIRKISESQKLIEGLDTRLFLDEYFGSYDFFETVAKGLSESLWRVGAGSTGTTLTWWLSLNSRLLAPGLQGSAARYNPEWTDVQARGVGRLRPYMMLRDELGGRKHIPFDEEDWSSIAFNAFLKSFEFFPHGKDQPGVSVHPPSIHRWISEVARQLNANALEKGEGSFKDLIKHWVRSISIVDGRMAGSLGVASLEAADSHHQLVLEPELMNWELGAADPRKLGQTVDRFFEGLLDPLKKDFSYRIGVRYCHQNNEKDAGVFRRDLQMILVSMFFEFLFLGNENLRKGLGDSSSLKSELNAFKQKWENVTGSWFFEDGETGIPIEVFDRIKEAHEMGLDFIDRWEESDEVEKAGISMVPTVKSWSTLALGTVLSGNPVSTLMVFSSGVLTRDQLEMPIQTLSPVLEEFSRREGEIRAWLLDRERNKTELRFRRAALMARNFSHNIGSHVLSNNLLGEGRSRPQEAFSIEVQKFYNDEDNLKKDSNPGVTFARDLDHYLQGRQDFISQVVEGAVTTEQPMLFWKDVLQPFMKQYLFHLTVVADQNYGYAMKTKPLRFRLVLPGGDVTEIEDKKVPMIATGDERLVGVANGAAGRHAFYATIENIIRNSAKYGVGSPEALEVTIELIEDNDNDRFIVRIHDNKGCGRDPEKKEKELKSTNEVREYLSVGLGEMEGKAPDLAMKGHGTREILECAQFLSGGHRETWFQPDRKVQQEKPANSEGYLEYINSESSSKTITQSSPLRCYHGGEGIVYELVLPQPTLLSLVSRQVSRESNLKLVRTFNRLSAAAGRGSHLLAIMADSLDQAMADELSRNLNALPLRIFLLAPAGALERIKAGTSDAEWERIYQNLPAGIRSRVKLVSQDDFPEVSGLLAGSLGTSDDPYMEEFQLILRLYEGWLKAFKPLPAGKDRWNLIISFDRSEPESVSKRWGEEVGKNGIAPLQNYELDSIETFILYDRDKLCTYGGKQSLSDLTTPGLGKNTILYDNHAKMVGKEDNSDQLKNQLGFFAETGGNNNDLFLTLFTPPTNPAVRDWFILSLVESSLLKVGVFDERLVDSLVPDNHGFLNSGAAEELCMMGIAPVLGLQVEEGGEVFLSPGVVKDPDHEPFILKLWDENHHPLMQDQGLDVLVIHLGLLEQAQKDGLINIEDHSSAFGAYPSHRFVVTSGRGTGGRDWGMGNPYVEFSVIGKSLVLSKNKHGLSSILMDAVAGKDESNA